MTATLFAVLSLALSDLASAQARVRLFGKVVDQAGREIAGVRVFLVSWPVRYLQIGEVDRIDVTSGVRGRFEASALDGRIYTVWGQIAEDGETVMTDVVETATAGKPIRLVRSARWPRPRIHVRGLERWKGQPLDVRVANTELSLDEQGRAEVPPLIGERLEVSVRLRDGPQIAVAQLQPGSDKALEIELAKPVQVDLVVTSKASGKPLARAAITQMRSILTIIGSGQPLPPLDIGTTDEAGRLTLTLPEALDTTPKRSGQQQFLVRAARHAATLVAVSPAEARTVTVALDAGSTLSGRLLRPDGQPAVGARLLVFSYVMTGGEPDRHSGVPPHPILCGPDGRFEHHGLTLRDPFQLLALLPGLGLPEAVTSPVHWLVRNEPARAENTDLGDLALDRLCDLELEVTRADGSAATAARIVPQEHMLSPWIEPVAGSHGKVRLLCPPGDLAIGAFEVDGGVGLERWQLAPGAQIRQLRLSQPVLVTGKVVDAHGAAVAGAWVRLWNRPEGPENALKELCFAQQDHQVVTGTDGVFRLHAAGIAGAHRLRAGHKSADGWTVSDQIRFTVDPERPTVPELRVVLPPPSPTGRKQ